MLATVVALLGVAMVPATAAEGTLAGRQRPRHREHRRRVPRRSRRHRLGRRAPDDWNPWLIRGQLDRFADNGVWHGINLVLRPLDLGIKWER